jgi:hypothetical protein
MREGILNERILYCAAWHYIGRVLGEAQAA